MRILITGGAGYIGSHAVRRFLARGHDVWVYDNLVYGHCQAVPSERLIVGDLADVKLLENVLRNKQIEAVVHFAAYAYVGESVREPAKYYHNNLSLSLGMLEVLRRLNIKRVVFSSTCATYGIPDVLPITEETPQRPINPYGWTKLLFERALMDYSQAYGWGVACLRYFNASGASPDSAIGEDHDPETHLIPLLLQTALKQRESIQIFGTDYETPDGTCIRDYVHVEDLAEAHLLALEALEDHCTLCYNLGTGMGYSVRDVHKAAEVVTGKSIPVIEQPRRPGDPPVLIASADKVRRELGWEPQYQTLEAILETAWNWHVTHPLGYESLLSVSS